VHNQNEEYYNQQQVPFNLILKQQSQYSYPPSSSQPFTSAEGEKFKKKNGYNDVWAAILFFLVLVGFGVCAYLGIVTAAEELDKTTGGATLAISNTDITALVIISVGGGFFLSLIYFALMRKFAGTLIKIQAVLFIVAFVAYGAFLVYARQFIIGVIVLVIAAVVAYFLYSWRSRIPFAKIMLKSVLQVIQQYPSTVTVGVIGMV
jgi:hypothetical protein